jgi:hypothetical protein
VRALVGKQFPGTGLVPFPDGDGINEMSNGILATGFQLIVNLGIVGCDAFGMDV